MILFFIFIISLVQYGFYCITFFYKLKIPSFVILTILTVGHLFIFPSFFYPEMDSNEPHCGMPILGVTLAFWVFGLISAFITHLSWVFIKKYLISKTLT